MLNVLLFVAVSSVTFALPLSRGRRLFPARLHWVLNRVKCASNFAFTESIPSMRRHCESMEKFRYFPEIGLPLSRVQFTHSNNGLEWGSECIWQCKHLAELDWAKPLYMIASKTIRGFLYAPKMLNELAWNYSKNVRYVGCICALFFPLSCSLVFI